MNRKPAALVLSVAAAASVAATGLSTVADNAAAATPTQVVAKTLPATKVTRANLPAASQIRINDAKVVTTGTFGGPGQAPIALCQTQSWANFKPNAQFSRIYDRASGVDAHAGVQVASFATHAQAVKAAAAMQRSLRCNAAAHDVWHVLPTSIFTRTRTITLRTGQTVYLNFTEYDVRGDDHATREDTAVYATGTHVALVNINYGTQYSDDGQLVRTVQATLPTVAR